MPRPLPFGLSRGPNSAYRRLASLGFAATRDREEIARFLTERLPVELSLAARVELLRRFVGITNAVRGYHTLAEMLRIARAILARGDRADLVVLEAGCAKGSSTAKLSLATARVGGRLLACDSFRGIPENTERHESLDGRPIQFRAGAFTGREASVRRVLERHGAPEVVTLVKGWFADTLPALDAHVDVLVLDVDLLSSTRTCLAASFPRLRPGGIAFSQDGHLRATVSLLSSARFWEDEVGVRPPAIFGLGERKLLEIHPRP